jgi:hypothetical protein
MNPTMQIREKADCHNLKGMSGMDAVALLGG